MAQPLLHGAQVDAGPEAPSGERCSELVQPEVFRVQFRALGNGLQIIEEVHLHITAGSWKDETAALTRFRLQCLQAGHQLCWDRNFPLFVRLWCPASIWF